MLEHSTEKNEQLLLTLKRNVRYFASSEKALEIDFLIRGREVEVASDYHDCGIDIQHGCTAWPWMGCHLTVSNGTWRGIKRP